MRGAVLYFLGLTGSVLLGLVSLLRPVVEIRIAALHVFRIGTLLATTEYWLRRRSLEQPVGGARRLDLFVAAPHMIVNDYVLGMIRRRLTVFKSRLLSSIFYATKDRHPDSPVWIDLGTTGPDDHGTWKNSTPQLLSFTDAEMVRGRRLLESLGIGPDEPFICFFARDEAYLNTRFPPERQNPPAKADQWRYHNFRDSNIESYRPMAERFAERGYWLLRMGAAVAKPISWDHPRIIDYANDHRSEFGDVFLLGNCRFFVGDSAGIHLMATAFNVPVALANVLPLSLIPCRSTKTLFIPKKCRSMAEDRLLTYGEILELGADEFRFTHMFEQAGIETVENTADEILGMACEMEAWIDGGAPGSEENERLRQKFWDIFPADYPSRDSDALVAADFLRRNQHLTVRGGDVPR